MDSADEEFINGSEDSNSSVAFYRRTEHLPANMHDVVEKPVADPEIDESKLREQFELLRKKGIYPCDYMDSYARFDETRLPS